MQNLCEAHVLYNINNTALCLIHFAYLSVSFLDVDNYSGVSNVDVASAESANNLFMVVHSPHWRASGYIIVHASNVHEKF